MSSKLGISQYIKKNYLIIGILIVACLFRFYNYFELQYLSDDENIVLAILDKMLVQNRPILATPNATTGINLGPFYHWISFPIFIISQKNPVIMGAFASLLGVAATYLIFLAGKTLKDKNLGYIASFIYASSFLTSLFDRRYWTLGPDSFIVALSLYALVHIVKKTSTLKHLLLLAIAISFTWNSDFSLAVIPIAVLISWFIYRIPFTKKEYILPIIYLIISLVPLLLFELRHDFVTFKSHKALSITSAMESNNVFYKKNPLTFALGSYANMILPDPNSFTDELLVYSEIRPEPLLSNIAIVIVLIIFILGLYWTFKQKKKILWIPWLYILSFTIGNYFFTGLMKQPFYQLYYAIVMPSFVFIVAYFINWLLSSKQRIPAIIFVVIFFSINLVALAKAKISVPTYQKMEVVKMIRNELSDEKIGFFSRIGGMAYPFLYHDLHPVKSNYHDAWYWVYAISSLFDVTPEVEWPDKIVYFDKTINISLNGYPHEIDRYTYRDITAVILDNQSDNLDSQILNDFNQL